MMSAKGSFDFFNKECVVGTAFSVDRTYFAGQLAAEDGVALAYETVSHTLQGVSHLLTLGGSTIGGGGKSSSATLNG